MRNLLMKKSTWLYLFLAILILPLTGCSEQSERTEQPANTAPALFFLVQLDKFIGELYPDALATGILALDNGYLRLKSRFGIGESNLIVWPPGYSARVDDDVVHVIDKDGKNVANTGDEIYLGGDQVSAEIVERYIGYSLPADCKGPYWLVGQIIQPPTLTSSPVSGPTSSDTSLISREQAIETASKTLPASIVVRANIKAEFHVWYWEVIFDNLNAEANELMPWPLKPPPPPPPGQPTSEPYPGIWQSVIITVNAETGDLKSTGARQAPAPGPYVSQEQAIESAMETVLQTPAHFNWGVEATWFGKARVEAYLRGDIWIVLFWEEGSTDNRFSVRVDAVTGQATGASRG